MTRYWWVNQTQTYVDERDLGILWAPHLNQAGRRQSHWDTMDDVRVGDVVFHYSDQIVKAVSRVVSAAREAQRPFQTQSWDLPGREVRVEIEELDLPFPLEAVSVELRLAQTHKNSPFSSTGRVNMGYLFEIDEQLGGYLLDLAGMLVDDRGGEDQTATDAPENPDGSPRRLAFELGTDGRAVAVYRREQGALRRRLLRGRSEAECDLCGRIVPASLLVTAHIKPRMRCSKRERVDPNIAILACVLGCDALFERGYMVVDAAGFVRSGVSLTPGSFLAAYLEPILDRAIEAHRAENAPYFRWHRQHHLELMH